MTPRRNTIAPQKSSSSSMPALANGYAHGHADILNPIHMVRVPSATNIGQRHCISTQLTATSSIDVARSAVPSTEFAATATVP